MPKSRNKRKRCGPQTSAGKMPALPATQALNLGYLNAATVVTRALTSVSSERWRTQIIVAGCGGIGAYLVQHIGRLMTVLYENQEGANLTLCDPDVVGEENRGRQLFCEAEVGQPKAIALARRYSQAWGLNTVAYVEEFSERFIIPDVDLTVLVGCVDNALARAALHEALRMNPDRLGPNTLPRLWWLDCGNLKDTGRVLLGSAYHVEMMRGAFITPESRGQQSETGKSRGHCLALPSPALQSPGLLIPEKPRATPEREMSCAERQIANMQSLNINAGIAAQAIDMLTRLLLTDDLKRYQCAVNLASGSVKSSYCTPEEVAREILKPTEFVIRNEQPYTERANQAVLEHLRELQEAVA